MLKNCEIGQRKVLSRGAEEAREKAMHYLRKVGMAPIFRDGLEYEFSVFFE